MDHVHPDMKAMVPETGAGQPMEHAAMRSATLAHLALVPPRAKSVDRVRLGLREMEPWMGVHVAGLNASREQHVFNLREERNVDRVHPAMRETALGMGVGQKQLHVAENPATLVPFA